MGGRNGFRQVLGAPGVLRTAAPYGLARVGVTMELLALLLTVHGRTGSWLQAGLVNSAFAVAAAVCAPLLGRAVDRRGQTGVLLGGAVLHLLGVLGVLLVPAHDPVVLAAGAAVAGAALPPLSSCMRVLWPLLVPEPLRGTAYTLESLLVEGAELSGPATVGLVASLLAPAAALLTAGVLVAGGALAFAASRPSRTWRTQRTAPRPTGQLLSVGPLRVQGVRLLVLVVLVGTAGFSALEVSVARFAAGAGQPAATGPLLGAMVVGSLLGAWCWGRRPRTAPAPDQLVLLMTASALLGLAPLLATGVWALGGLLVVTGLLIAPTTSVQFLLLTDVAPEDGRTEAFTWASTAAFLGVASGTAAGGSAVGVAGASGGVLLAAALAVVAALLAVRTRSALRPGPAVRVVHPEEHDEVVRERDEALAALRAYGERCDAMARELATLRQERREAALAAVGSQVRPHLRAVASEGVPAVP